MHYCVYLQATGTCSSVSQMDPPSMQPPTKGMQGYTRLMCSQSILVYFSCDYIIGDTMLVSEKEGFEKNIAPLIIERARDLESNPK